MKNLIVLGLFAWVTLTASLGLGSTVKACLPYPETHISRDPGDTFPWGSELPFPWKGIQGTWATTFDGCTAYFAFKTVRSSTGTNQLQVVQFDTNSCMIVSRGVGFEDDRVVKAVMTDKRQRTFSLTVHVFDKSDLRNQLSGNYTAKTVTVMNMSPLGSPESRESYQLSKLSNDPRGICE